MSLQTDPDHESRPSAPFDPVYLNYWACKQLRAERLPHFPLARWWSDPGLCEIERIYVDAVGDAASLLDVGAGDLRIMRKFRAAGYAGEYHTQDIGGEFAYDYRDLSEVRRTYQAVVCLDVIEHLPLRDGMALLLRLVDLLSPGGVLILQTPNARCLNDPMSWDFSHLHCYNVADLWSYLTALGLETRGWRVAFEEPRRSLGRRLQDGLSRLLTTRLLNADYAANIALIARKPPSPGSPAS